MLAFANDGMMIPEQVWDRRDLAGTKLKFGEGTGSATPLAWSMAQFVRLALNINRQKNLETPTVVADRYLKRTSKYGLPKS
jgi:glucoamylase